MTGFRKTFQKSLHPTPQDTPEDHPRKNNATDRSQKTPMRTPWKKSVGHPEGHPARLVFHCITMKALILSLYHLCTFKYNAQLSKMSRSYFWKKYLHRKAAWPLTIDQWLCKKLSDNCSQLYFVYDARVHLQNVCYNLIYFIYGYCFVNAYAESFFIYKWNVLLLKW